MHAELLSCYSKNEAVACAVAWLAPFSVIVRTHSITDTAAVQIIIEKPMHDNSLYEKSNSCSHCVQRNE